VFKLILLADPHTMQDFVQLWDAALQPPALKAIVSATNLTGLDAGGAQIAPGGTLNVGATPIQCRGTQLAGQTRPGRRQ